MSVCKRVVSVGFGPGLDSPARGWCSASHGAGSHDWLPKKTGGQGERHDNVETICTVPLDCGTPTTRRLYPFGAPTHHYQIHRKLYIKGRKAYTTFGNKTSTQRQFKNGVPHGGVLSPTLQHIHINPSYSVLTNKCLLLLSYLNKIDEDKHTSPLCPLCKSEPHTTRVFKCTNINTQV